MAGDPRSTRQWGRIRRRWIDWGKANEIPCARPGCDLGPIRYDLSGNHPLAPNLGHIIEQDRGIDPFDETNLQLEHASCNSSAGASYRNRKHNTRKQSRQW